MRIIYLFLIFFSFRISVNAQIRINEICGDNETVFTDRFGDSPDWIEIYNMSEDPVLLSNYFISNNIDTPTKWLLPNTFLAPKEYFLLIASGRGLVTDRIHSNFEVDELGDVIYLYERTGTLIDRISLPKIETDRSYGRINDGLAPYGVFPEPTPGISNSFSDPLEFALIPEFSVFNQFQSEVFELQLITLDSSDIYFTLDGSEPNFSSKKYTKPIQIGKNTVVKASAFSNEKLWSPIATNTYFIGEQSTLPIISLSTDSLFLFDENDGLLVEGMDAQSEFPFFGANYWKGIEIPIHLEYFDENGKFLIEFSSSCTVHGDEFSRTNPQKSFLLTAKPAFGNDKFRFSFFEKKPNVQTFEKLILRNSSSDFSDTHFRDGFISDYLMADGIDLDVMGYQPCNVFLNGEYWGVMNLREASDESFFTSNLGTDLNKIDILEADVTALWGDSNIFQEDFDFVRQNNLEEEFAYGEIARRLEVEAFADYIIAQTFLNNTEWGHKNLRIWREKSRFSKWRYLFYNLDASMAGLPETEATNQVFIQKMNEYIDDENVHIFMFKNMLNNELFKNYFINRYCDLLNTIFREEIFSEALEEHADKMRPAMLQHFERWKCPTCNSFDEWENEFIPKIIQYSIDKPNLSRQELKTYFELDSEVNIELDVFPPEAGKIKINSLMIDEFPWDGLYYNGIPVNIEVIPNLGFSFEKWDFNNFSTNLIDSKLEVKIDTDEKITAVFSDLKNQKREIYVSPNPAKDEVKLQFFIKNASSILQFDIMNLEGQLVFRSLPKRYFQGLVETTLPIELLSSGIYFIRTTFDGEVKLSKFVKI